MYSEVIDIFMKEIKSFKGLKFDFNKGFIVDANKLIKLIEMVNQKVKYTLDIYCDLDVHVGLLDNVEYPVVVLDVVDITSRLVVDRKVVVLSYKIKSWDELLAIGIYFYDKNQFDSFSTLIKDNVIYQNKIANAKIDFKETPLGLGLTVSTEANKIVFPKK